MEFGPFRQCNKAFIDQCVKEGTMDEDTQGAVMAEVPWSEDTITVCFLASGIEIKRHNVDGMLIDRHTFSAKRIEHGK